MNRLLIHSHSLLENIQNYKIYAGGLDFIETKQLLLFNKTVMSYEIDVVIINNSRAEPTEYFLAVLTPVEPLPENVFIRPAVANVTIVDGRFE